MMTSSAVFGNLYLFAVLLLLRARKKAKQSHKCRDQSSREAFDNVAGRLTSWVSLCWKGKNCLWPCFILFLPKRRDKFLCATFVRPARNGPSLRFCQMAETITRFWRSLPMPHWRKSERRSSGKSKSAIPTSTRARSRERSSSGSERVTKSWVTPKAESSMITNILWRRGLQGLPLAKSSRI